MIFGLFDIQYAAELLGTFVFAISGAVAMRDLEHDMFGAGFTGFITAIGGGSLRDMLLGSYPLAWIGDVNYLYAILLGIFAALVFSRPFSSLRKTFFLFDTFGIGLFTVLGVEKALSVGASVEIAAIMGMFSAVMGGVIRDTLTNTIPVLFRKEIYASACLFGAITYLILNHFGIGRDANMLVSMSLIIVVRLLAVRLKLSLPNMR